MISKSVAIFTNSPVREIPSPYMISTMASLNGGATLFFTTLILVSLPTLVSFGHQYPWFGYFHEHLNEPKHRFKARPPGVVSGFPNMTPTFSRNWLIKMAMVLVLLIEAPEFAHRGSSFELANQRDYPRFSIDFRTWYQGSNRVDNHQVNRPRVDQFTSNFKSLFPWVWLRQEKFVDINPKSCCIWWIQRHARHR